MRAWTAVSCALRQNLAPTTTLTGIERYLGSGLVKGIGPVYAGQLVQAFGAAVFDVIEPSPERLREIPGIGDVRAQKIRSGWTARDIRSIGFLSADTIARDSPQRAQAGVSYALSEASSQGHCGLPYVELLPLAVKLIDLPEAIIETAIAQEIEDEVLFPDTVDGQPCVFMAPLYGADQSIAVQIQRLNA